MRKSIVIAAAATLFSVRADAQERTSPAFWERLGDTVLTRLVAEATRTGTSVQIAEARADEARAAHRLAAFDLVPTVTASGSALRTRLSMAEVPGLTTPLPERDLYDFGFSAAWELDVFGRVRRGVSAQSAFAGSAERSVDDAQVSLSADVANAYFELRGAQRQLAVALGNADVQRKTVALAQDRLAAGRGTAFDVERARSVLQLTLAAVPAIEAQIAAAQYRIGALIGRAPGAVSADLLADGPLPDLPDSVAIDAPLTVVRHRPDVLAAEQQLAGQTLLVSAAQADYLPRFSLAGTTGYTADQFSSLTRTGTSRVVFGPVVSFPLLDLGRVRQRVGIAHAAESEARARYTATVLQATQETQTAVVAYDRARERVVLLGDAVKSSEHALALAQQRFEAGLTDFLQVLDAQRTSLDAENQLATAHTAAAEALVALYRATGGTWTPR